MSPGLSDIIPSILEAIQTGGATNIKCLVITAICLAIIFRIFVIYAARILGVKRAPTGDEAAYGLRYNERPHEFVSLYHINARRDLFRRMLIVLVCLSVMTISLEVMTHITGFLIPLPIFIMLAMVLYGMWSHFSKEAGVTNSKVLRQKQVLAEVAAEEKAKAAEWAQFNNRNQHIE